MSKNEIFSKEQQDRLISGYLKTMGNRVFSSDREYAEYWFRHQDTGLHRNWEQLNDEARDFWTLLVAWIRQEIKRGRKGK